MNKPIRRVALFCFLLIVSLLVSSNYIQVVNADNYKARPANSRNLLDAYAYPRGVIKTADGVVIADSVPSGGVNYKYQRQYPKKQDYANVTGYKSLYYGSTGLESIYNKYLQGDDSSESVANFLNTLTGKAKTGGSLQLTVSDKVQQAAISKLDGRQGSVVALDPTTGAILAMYSSPSFDPNGIAANLGASAKAAGDKLEADKNKPNLNHALAETYPPGSIFKVITAAAALDSGKFNENDQTPADPNAVKFPGSSYTLGNENGSACPDTSLKTALQNSCNSVFGYVGDQLGVNAMEDTAVKFGLNNAHVKVPQTAAQSVFPAAEIGSDPIHLAQSAIGQFDTRITVLQAAMIAAAVANKGTLMQPYMVDKEISPRGGVTYDAADHRSVLGQAMSPSTAAALNDMMVNVVENGTGTNARIPGITVGGKTGTAQRSTGQAAGQNPLAWFISYATAPNGKSVAVAVLVEDDNASHRDDITGGGFAAPVAQAVMEAALGVGPQGATRLEDSDHGLRRNARCGPWSTDQSVFDLTSVR